jgi:hypothetical protein
VRSLRSLQCRANLPEKPLPQRGDRAADAALCNKQSKKPASTVRFGCWNTDSCSAALLA